ncbi:MAG: hypothetical protein WHT65_09885 [Pseudothermotoga sp.]
MKNYRWIILIALCLCQVMLSQQLLQLPDESKRPSLVVQPQILVFSPNEIREKTILLYNTNTRSAISWTVSYSRFIKVQSDLPNPLQPLSGGYLRVSILWNLVDSEIIRIENPDVLHTLISKIFGIDLPSKPLGFGMIAIGEKNSLSVHTVMVIVVK